VVDPETLEVHPDWERFDTGYYQWRYVHKGGERVRVMQYKSALGGEGVLRGDAFADDIRLSELETMLVLVCGPEKTVLKYGRGGRGRQ